MGERSATFYALACDDDEVVCERAVALVAAAFHENLVATTHSLHLPCLTSHKDTPPCATHVLAAERGWRQHLAAFL